MLIFVINHLFMVFVSRGRSSLFFNEMTILFDEIEAFLLTTMRVFMQGNLLFFLRHVAERTSLFKLFCHGLWVVLVGLNLGECACVHCILVSHVALVSIVSKVRNSLEFKVMIDVIELRFR